MTCKFYLYFDLNYTDFERWKKMAVKIIKLD